MADTVRIGSANAGSATRRALDIAFDLETPALVYEHVERAVGILGQIVDKAGAAGCDVLAIPEDCLGLAKWESAHPAALGEVLPEAVRRMTERLGRAASRHGMYLVLCSDNVDSSGALRNTAFFLGRNGREIGRYHKVSLPAQEQSKVAGDAFPVFATPDLGGVGMLICYDMVFPECMRALTLAGADIVFVPTEGGAAFGAQELGRTAFQVRAVENFTYVVVSWGGWGDGIGSMVISPRGEILAEERRAGEIAIADIDPLGGRQNQDWANAQDDMRARLFRERRPAAYGLLSQLEPPIMEHLPPLQPGPEKEIVRIYQRSTTLGHREWERAEEHLRAGRTREAIEAFEAMRRDYPCTWFDREARRNLETLRGPGC